MLSGYTHPSRYLSKVPHSSTYPINTTYYKRHYKIHEIQKPYTVTVPKQLILLLLEVQADEDILYSSRCPGGVLCSRLKD
jgi:hypothetical protein